MLFFIVADALPSNDIYEAGSGYCFALGYIASRRGSASPEQDIFHKRSLSEP